MRAKMAVAEMRKLVDFFRADGIAFGVAGDADELTPAETAIKALKAYLHLRTESGDEADVFGREWESRPKRRRP